jgi:hypothetical protein
MHRENIVLRVQNYTERKYSMPIPVAALSKAYVGGQVLAGIVGSNPTGGMGVFLLYSVCVVR